MERPEYKRGEVIFFHNKITMVSLWSQIMFRYEYKQKVQCWGFQTLALPQNLCVQKHNTVQYMRVGQLLLFWLLLSVCPPPWVFMLVGNSGDLKKHKHLQSQDWSSHIHPNDQKGSKEFVMVTSWVHPCLLSTLEMASGTNSIPALGLTKQMHAETAALYLHSHLQALSMQW